MAHINNIIMDQGASFETSLYLQDSAGNARDLTGYTAVCQMRKNHYSPSFFSVTTSIPYPTTGVVNLSLTPDQTYIIEPGRYVYEVIIISNDGVVAKIAEGVITVTPSVIR